MKNLLLALALVLSVPAFAGDQPDQPQQPEPAPAPAPVPQQPAGPQDMFAYACTLDADMAGIRLGMGMSGEVMGGRGTIHCSDKRAGQEYTVDLPVKITVLGAGPGFDFSVVKHVKMISGGVGYVRSPMDLTGSFSLAASAGITFINHGWSIDSAVSVKKHGRGLGFELGFMSEEAYGLGAHLHGLVMIVNPVRHPNR